MWHQPQVKYSQATSVAPPTSTAAPHQYTAPIAPTLQQSTATDFQHQYTAPIAPTLQQSAFTDLQQGYSLLANKLTDLVDKIATPKPATPPRRELPKITTPIFTGNNDSSFEIWRTSLEDMFAYLQWPIDDPMRLLLLPTALTDYAKIHYNSLPQSDKTDYNTAMAALAKNFSVAHQPPTTKAAKLQRKQGPTESVREYNLEITRRIQECNVTDPERQLEIYIQNLRSDIAQRVLLMVPTTLRQAQTAADIVEQSLNLNHDPSMMAFQSNNNQRRQDYPRRSRADSYNKNRADTSGNNYRRSSSRDYNNRRSASRDRNRSTSGNRDRRTRSWSREDQRRQFPRNRSNSAPRSPGRNNRDRYDRSPTPYGDINAIHANEDHVSKN